MGCKFADKMFHCMNDIPSFHSAAVRPVCLETLRLGGRKKQQTVHTLGHMIYKLGYKAALAIRERGEWRMRCNEGDIFILPPFKRGRFEEDLGETKWGARKWACRQGRVQINRPSRPILSYSERGSRYRSRYTTTFKTKIRSQSASFLAYLADPSPPRHTPR